MMKLKFESLNLLLLLRLLLVLLCAAADHDEPSSRRSIVFTTVGRGDYAFDVFTLPTDGPLTPTNELRMTDGKSVSFNGHFPNSPSFSSFVSSQTPNRLPSQPLLELVYITERNGSSNIYYDAFYHDAPGSRPAVEFPSRVQVPLLGAVDVQKGKIGISMKDRPTVAGDSLIYVSNHDDPGVARASWAAVYSTEFSTGLTRRLTPFGIADFSPAVSPSGTWTAVASYGEKGWSGEVEELSTDIYVFLTRDGTRRVKVVEHGGWPSWVDDSTLYFHRSAEDKWISVYRVILPTQGPVTANSVIVERVTPPGVHAFTPATAPGNKNFIAVATRRPTSKFRHIELYDLFKKEFKELTRLVSPATHHYNPFISPDSIRVGYHKCRGGGSLGRKGPLFLENLRSPDPELSLFRIDGSFPSFSPKGDRVAYNGPGFMGVYVANQDGSNLRKVYPESAFSTAWDPIREEVVYTSTGPTLASESTEVDVISINVDDGNYKKLTTNGENNAFPSPSPDGKRVVFRSGRSGHKNLYIMDAVNGERVGLSRITEGPWTDTMCSWSPDGDLIAFASDRVIPGSYELYLIHPNGTGLRKLIQSGSGGQANHPYFSPDGKTIAFTSDYAGISAEPISNPEQLRPYGEIFTVKLDGSDLKRLTYDSYEDGTPAWSPSYIKPVDVEPSNEDEDGSVCDFDDCLWLNTTTNAAPVPAAAHLVSHNAQCGA